MAFEIAPDPGDRGESGIAHGRSGSAAASERRRLVQDGLQVLARGALVCPSCALPVYPQPRIRPRAALRCAFCDHTAAAIEYLREDTFDVAANDVILVARLS